jgi:hypothetical protein
MIFHDLLASLRRSETRLMLTLVCSGFIPSIIAIHWYVTRLR